MRQSDIDKRVKELTDEAEMLGKQKRTLELLEECSKYGHEIKLDSGRTDVPSDMYNAPRLVGITCQRCGAYAIYDTAAESDEAGADWMLPYQSGFPNANIASIWEGIEPPAPQLEEEELSSKQTTLDEYTDTKVESEKTESGAYRVSWGGLGKKEANE